MLGHELQIAPLEFQSKPEDAKSFIAERLGSTSTAPVEKQSVVRVSLHVDALNNPEGALAQGRDNVPIPVPVPVPIDIRADAQRNEDAVLQAAKELFTALGVDAPVREIAARAGVGMGTLYRRFPKRSDLVAGVFRREVDACAAEALALAARLPPGGALACWLECYADFLTTKKGLAAALHSGNPAFDALPNYFRARFEPALAALLRAAAAAGEVRGNVEPYDLLRAIGNLSSATGDDGPAHARRMIELLIDGLRHGARDQRT